MSDSADVLVYDWDTIVVAIMDHGCDDMRTVENVLNLFGKKIGDKYVILSSSHNDFNEDSLLPMCKALDKIFGTDDMYSDVLDINSEYIGGFASHRCAGDNDRIINTLMCEWCNAQKTSQLDLARQRAAQAWCEPSTGSITMIPELAFAFADILMEAMAYAHIELDENLDYRTVDE